MKKFFKSHPFLSLLVSAISMVIIAFVVASINVATGGSVIAATFLIAGFTEEQSKSFNDFMTKQSKDVQDKVKELIDSIKNSDVITGIKKMLEGEDGKGGLAGNFKQMQEQLDAIATEQAKAKKEGVPEKTKTFAQELREQFTKEAENLKGMTADKVKEVKLSVKAFLETANASVTTGSLIPTPQFEAGVSKAPDRMPFILDIITTGIANSLTVYWTQRKTRTDNSGFVTEGTLTTVGGGAVTESVLGYETKNASMQNILEFIKVSNNSIDDVEWLMSEIQTELVTLLALKLDAALLTGTVAVNGFDGIYTAATAFNAAGATLPAGVVPNEYDVLMFAATQIKKANFRPNYVVLNPTDILKMKLSRDEDGGYLFPPYMNVDPQIAGVRVVENNGITAGTYLIGDFSKAKFWMRKGIEIKIYDQNDTDAQLQLKTITGYMRGVLVVKDADKLAFVKDTFADSIEEIKLV